ncbi:hypothetical protein LJK88_21155 [Paenibacillus sp. P26]|nr:hypothetical protein LJK88_21155 [Paenibacillus sp. P26]
MRVLLKGIQVSLALFLIVGLLFASAVFGVLLYARITGKVWFEEGTAAASIAYAKDQGSKQDSAAAPSSGTAQAQAPASVLLDAPLSASFPSSGPGAK